MSYSTGFSTSSVNAAVLALAILGAGAPADPVRAAPPDNAASRPRPRIALLPAENLAAVPVPLRGIDAQVERTMAAAGIEVVSGEAVERFMERHRLRYTGGIDDTATAAAREELGVDGLLLTAVSAYDTSSVPRLAVTQRVVGASAEAPVLWMDATARAGNDSPGFLGLGIVTSFRDLEDREFRRLAASLAATMDGVASRVSPCPEDGRFRPRIAFRAPGFDPARQFTVAVLPFVNQSTRRRAGDLVALELVRQLAAVDRIRVIEPGVVRSRLIARRVIMEGGVSVDAARTVVNALGADLVVAGYVRSYVDGDEPSADYTALALEAEKGTIVWEGTSASTGSQGVWFFGLGRQATLGGLACRMLQASVASAFGSR